MAGSEQKEKQLEHAEEQRRASKEDLLRPQLREEPIFIESLGYEIVICSLSKKKRDEIRGECGYGSDNWDEAKASALQILACVKDPQLTYEDLERLDEQSAEIIDEINLHISLHNWTGRTEELKKDSSEIQNSDSPSS
jgi:hypothetical protein